MQTSKNIRLPLLTIYLTVILDMAGIGLVLPVLPDLFGAQQPGTGTGMAYGLFLSLYALMQFLCAPLLGGWSDRIGRKPVLTISLIGAALNYAVMACLPSKTCRWPCSSPPCRSILV